jgi:flagellar protein FlgJ
MAVDRSSGVRPDVVTEMGGLDRLRRSARDGDPEAVRGAARQFEALMVTMLMKSMRDAAGEDSLFGSQQGKMYGSMLDAQLAQSIAGRGIGVADMLVRQMTGSATAGRTPVGPQVVGLPSRPEDGKSRQEAKLSPVCSHASSALSRAAAYSDQGGPAAFQSRFARYAEQASSATGLPASFILGQAAVESGYGKREIRSSDGVPSYNLFSLKAGRSWHGKTVEVMTTEYVDGAPRKLVQKFRAYDSYDEAFADYANLLTRDSRYREVLAQTASSSGFAKALQSAGYATDPAYAAKVTRAIDHAIAAGA